MDNIPTIIFSGIISGAILGLIGAGSGIIATVLLIYILNIPIHQAITISLVNTGISALSSTIKNLYKKNLDYKIILSIFLPSLFLIPLGAKLNAITPNKLLELIYAVLVLLISLLMWYNAKKNIPAIDKTTTPYQTKIDTIKYIIIGCITGFLSSYLGLSGGIIIIPGLVIFLEIPIKKAIANSIALITLIAFASYISHNFIGNKVNLLIALYFSIGGIIGMYLGSIFQKRSSDILLKKIFALFLMIIGIIILFKTTI